MKRKLLFLTGTRADFGKLKSLIVAATEISEFEVSVFVTGMHLLSKYGHTHEEVSNLKKIKIHKFINQNHSDSMDAVLSKTVGGLSDYVKENRPDMIIVHGDRVEALAGAIVGCLNNILVSHIEGGELSGTIDESIRHSITKLAHIHFVSNEKAKQRLLQLGELAQTIKVIGSPDIDLMISDELPSLNEVRSRYDIVHKQFGVLLFHSVTTELERIPQYAETLCNALIESNKEYVVIFPNNDLGSQYIITAYKKFLEGPKFRIFPSMRFEYFLTLLKNADFMIGNSSAGVREAPFYGLPSINIGSRQNRRAISGSILNVEFNKEEILSAITMACQTKHRVPFREFGDGKSRIHFTNIMSSPEIWSIPIQKVFNDFQ